MDQNIPVIPVLGSSSLILLINEFTFGSSFITLVFNCLIICGFLPKHAGTRRERLIVSANEAATRVFIVPYHKLSQFLE